MSNVPKEMQERVRDILYEVRHSRSINDVLPDIISLLEEIDRKARIDEDNELIEWTKLDTIKREIDLVSLQIVRIAARKRIADLKSLGKEGK